METFRWVRRVAGLLIALWLVYYLVIYVGHAQALLRFPYDYDQGEGYDVNSAWVLSWGGSIYASPSQYPYYSSNYPPLYPLLLAPFVAAWGPQLALGRLLSLIATAFTVGLIGFAVYLEPLNINPPSRLRFASSADKRRADLCSMALESRRWRPALAAALLFIASPYVYHTTPLARVNALMVALALGGVYAVSQGAEQQDGKAWGWLAAGGALLLAALYTKQMAIDAVAAALTYLALRNWQRGLTLGAAILGAGGAIYLALEVGTRGGFSLNVLWANANPFDWQQAEAYYRNFLTIHLLLVVAGVALLALPLLRRGPRGISAYALYFVAALIVAVGTGKWGAGESYFLSAIAAGCILLGQALAWVEAAMERAALDMERQPGKWLPAVAAYSLVFVTCVALTMQLGRYWHGPSSWPVLGLTDRGIQARVLGRSPAAADTLAGNQIVSYITQTPGDTLAEECGFTLKAGRPVLGNTTQQLNLYQARRYNPQPLVNALDQGKISLVVLNAQRYPAPVLAAIGRDCNAVASYTINGFDYRVLQCHCGQVISGR